MLVRVSEVSTLSVCGVALFWLRSRRAVVMPWDYAPPSPSNSGIFNLLPKRATNKQKKLPRVSCPQHFPTKDPLTLGVDRHRLKNNTSPESWAQARMALPVWAIWLRTSPSLLVLIVWSARALGGSFVTSQTVICDT